ncbi:beta-1,4-mannosyltransferase [Thelephora ganbajun]|uniref:Beta-1,4-mannosyltransferase n=1 Tax=Thelephora ganbajun TaxID=370292 RepID=A0ACB6ZNU4_THEGA|nr:beta-1,4-mannosyltransferase [Thelephora ganbajun]
MRSVVVFVLGDVGRSPRMMYHAESFANDGFETYIVGYHGSKPTPALLSTPHVQFFYLHQLPQFFSRLPFMIVTPIKIIHQVLAVFITLLFTVPNTPEFIIAQNPPSIPTLMVMWVISYVRPTKVIIDWHNLGYTILALKLGETHLMVRLAKLIEKYFGRIAYAHLFVTNAMQDFLVTRWNLRGLKIVLHDRPPSHFHRCSPSETHELFCRLDPNLTSCSSLRSFLPEFEVPYSTPFTMGVPTAPSIWSLRDGTPSSVHFPTLRAERTALLVSSTSWTADEDFGLLLEALDIYNRVASAKGGEKTLPRILVMITGKGPLKDMYMGKIQRTQHAWDFVRCTSTWLDTADYPLLLGSADIGICLHSSSSALDLPMKIVDMFGCGLPVCALDFACLQELVRPGWNGLIFGSSEELAGHLISLLRGFPRSPTLETLKSAFVKTLESPSPSSAHSFSSSTDVCQGVGSKWEWTSWADNWNEFVQPIVSESHISQQ